MVVQYSIVFISCIASIAIVCFWIFCIYNECRRICNNNYCGYIIFIRQNRENDLENNIDTESSMKFNPLFISDNKHLKSDKCTICLEHVNNIPLVCGHVFHNKCITKWLDKHKTCPNCREKL